MSMSIQYMEPHDWSSFCFARVSTGGLKLDAVPNVLHSNYVVGG